MTRSWFRSL